MRSINRPPVLCPASQLNSSIGVVTDQKRNPADESDEVAAYLAQDDDDEEGKTVLDVGSGTGIWQVITDKPFTCFHLRAWSSV